MLLRSFFREFAERRGPAVRARNRYPVHETVAFVVEQVRPDVLRLIFAGSG